MSQSLRPSVLRHPECIHPRLWRASQLAAPACSTVSTGHPQLDVQLPGGGWPVGTLTELLSARAGIGEIQLLGPALRHGRSGGRLIAFVNPPLIPSATWLDHWLGGQRSLLWLRPQTAGDALWTAQTILEHGVCASLLCWFDAANGVALHRLHLAAQKADTLFFALRPLPARSQASFAPLRLQLDRNPGGLDVRILKRRGPALPDSITLPLDHGSLDQRSPALRPGQPA